MSRQRVAVVGGGIAGVTAAWQIARLAGEPGRNVELTLFEASSRLGGTVETTRREGFLFEGGPDGWVSEKPWANQLARDLGLGEQLIPSLDADRVTYIVQAGKLVPMPDGMRMMVPTDLRALDGSPLFSDTARAAYAEEATRSEILRATAPTQDESVSDFVRRHFGEEVLTKIGGPLLSGVFGGDVTKLSVRAVMPRFVDMEREHGSLVQALAGKTSNHQNSIFTSLRDGVETLVERMTAAIPDDWKRLGTPVTKLKRAGSAWQLTLGGHGGPDTKEPFDAVLLATPAHISKRLLGGLDPRIAENLEMDASSAVLASLAFDRHFDLPRGFGFLVPEGEGSGLLAGTFVDGKYPGRTPKGGRLLRGFFGGRLAAELAHKSDADVAVRALDEFRALLGPLPEPRLSLVRRWPRSLPQYGLGHLDRMKELDQLVAGEPGLKLIGNAYHGVGLPDLIRDARAAAHATLS